MSDFRAFGPDEVARRLPWDALIESLERVIADPSGQVPERTVHPVAVRDGDDASLLMKPAWVVGDSIVVKAVTFFPDNGRLGHPTVNAGVLLFSAVDGRLLGACDGNELTTRRTAAASAIAAKHLVRPGASRLLVVGTGALAPMVAEAHHAVHRYEAIEVWGRSADKAGVVADGLRSAGLPARVAEDLDGAVASADVISAVTSTTTPLIAGALVRPGTHVDLIGSFSPDMRESDDDLVRAASIFVDTRADGVLAGDLAQPLADGVISLDDIHADLADLVRGTHSGRTSDDEVTVFKSAGIALEDLAAARLVFDTS